MDMTLDEYLDSCFDFCERAAEAGIFAVMRLWNAGGEDSLNPYILDRMHAYFEGEWQTLYSGYKLKEYVFLEWGERFEWPDERAEECGGDHSCYGLRDQIGVLSDGTVVYVNYKQWSTSVQPDDFPCSMAEAIEKTIETISAGEGQDMRAQLLSDAFIINVKVQEVNDWEEGVHMGKYWQWNVRFSAPYEQQPYQYQVSINAETGEAQAFFDPREVFRTQVDWQENHNGNG